MSDVQTLHSDSPNSAVTTNATTELATETAASEEAKRRRRKFRSEEILMAHRFLDLAPIGEAIQYETLAPEMKLVALGRSMRLVQFELLEPDYNLATGALISVTVDKDKWDEYEDDLKKPEPIAPVARERRQRNPILLDNKYKLVIVSKINPRREGTHAYLNWQYCYREGMSLPEYLHPLDYSNTPYPRELIVTSFRTGQKSYFDGPKMIFLIQDMKANHIKVCDSSVATDHPKHWLTPFDLYSIEEEDEDEENENAADSATVSQGPETLPPAA
jgi:hypothetical protein